MRSFRRSGTIIVILQLLLGRLAAPDACGGSIAIQLTTAEKQDLQREARLVVDLLQNSHYSGRAFREIDNHTMLARFLEEMDPQAEFFDRAAVDFIHRRFDRTFKSVYLFRGDLQPAFEIFDRFIALARDRMEWTQKRLDRGFDFTLDETYAERTAPAPFQTKAEADRHWELLLKEWVVFEQLRGREPRAATAEVKRRYADFERDLAAFDSLAVRERFFDSIIRAYDPHSGYFSSDSAREFALAMEKSVVGLGLDLRKENGQCVVASVHVAGSADLNSGIAPGDVIEALAEGDGPWVNLGGLRLREIVGLMRGPAGAKLRVAYRPGGAEARIEATLERTRIVLGANRAQGAVSMVPGMGSKLRRIGWIDLPEFYAAGENAELTSAARDVRELLQQMTATPLDGLVIDLRDNPGGALNEAVALSEIFLPRGTMMLSRGLDGRVREHPLKENEPAYTGPLVVLTSAQSASASEVFAGAMKYHRRAVVVGATSTFGKGTVQAYIELSKMPQGAQAGDWGTLRLTMERFYLPDGKSVQRTGIPADIILPGLEPPPGSRREADLPGAFPEETVPAPAGIAPVATAVSASLLVRLGEAAAAHLGDLPEWKLFQEEQKLAQWSASREARSLVLEQRETAWAAQRLAREDARRTRRELAATSSYPTQAHEIAAVRSAREVHEARLRAADRDGRPSLHQLQQGSFIVETDQGRRRKLRLDGLEFQNFSGDTATLAAAFSAGAGFRASPAAIAALLGDLSLLEHKTDAAVLAAAGKLSGGTLDEDAARRGVEAMLGRMTELDGDLLRERPALDVPLRESLRLAADWADLIESNSAH